MNEAIKATVEVKHRDVPRFQYWLAHRTEEITHNLSGRVENDGAEAALSDLKEAENRLVAVRKLMEQGQKAVAGETTTYSGDAVTLLDVCHAMVGEYGPLVAIHDDPEPWDFSAAENALDGLAYWVRMGNKVQTRLMNEVNA